MAKKIKPVRKLVVNPASGCPRKVDPNDKGCLLPSYDSLVSEIYNYRDVLEGAVVYLYSEEPDNPVMWRYFTQHFDDYKLRHLACSQRIVNGKGKIRELDSDQRCRSAVMNGTGAFKSDPCQRVLRKCDVFVSVVPFSRVREFVYRLNLSGCKFLILVELDGKAEDYLEKYESDGVLVKGVNDGADTARLSYEKDAGKVVRACWYTNILP